MDEIEEQIEAARRSGASRLDLAGRGLTTLPASLGALTGLTELFVYGNRFAELPPPLRNLTSLARLSLAGNHLATLPDWLGELTALTWLNVAGNRLAALPESVGNLTGLTTLHLAGNRLTALPESLGRLTALTRLDLFDNQLTTLPGSLGDLTALARLDLAGNPLTVVPAWLTRPVDDLPAPVPLQAWADGSGTTVAHPADLDAVLDRRPPDGVTLISDDGERQLYVNLRGSESWLMWEGDHDILLSWGPVPPGAPAGQVAVDYDNALSDPWFGSLEDDEPLGISEALARRAGHEFLRTGRRPRCVQWMEKP